MRARVAQEICRSPYICIAWFPFVIMLQGIVTAQNPAFPLYPPLPGSRRTTWWMCCSRPLQPLPLLEHPVRPRKQRRSFRQGTHYMVEGVIGDSDNDFSSDVVVDFRGWSWLCVERNAVLPRLAGPTIA